MTKRSLIQNYSSLEERRQEFEFWLTWNWIIKLTQQPFKGTIYEYKSRVKEYTLIMTHRKPPLVCLTALLVGHCYGNEGLNSRKWSYYCHYLVQPIQGSAGFNYSSFPGSRAGHHKKHGGNPNALSYPMNIKEEHQLKRRMCSRAVGCFQCLLVCWPLSTWSWPEQSIRRGNANSHRSV